MAEPSGVGRAGALLERGLRLAADRVAQAVRAHRRLVLRVLRRAGLRPGDADDAAQDVFWVLARRLDDIHVQAERSFLVTTARRVAADRHRMRWHRSIESELDVESLSSAEPLPDAVIERRRMLRLLDEALDALNDEQRTVFQLVELEQMTRQEVAALLGLPPGTVGSRLAKARELFEATAASIRARLSRDSMSEDHELSQRSVEAGRRDDPDVL